MCLYEQTITEHPLDQLLFTSLLERRGWAEGETITVKDLLFTKRMMPGKERGISRSHQFWLKTSSSGLVPFSAAALKKRSSGPTSEVGQPGELVKPSPSEVKVPEFKI